MQKHRILTFVLTVPNFKTLSKLWNRLVKSFREQYRAPPTIVSRGTEEGAVGEKSPPATGVWLEILAPQQVKRDSSTKTSISHELLHEQIYGRI